jgi:hypothetical protein
MNKLISWIIEADVLGVEASLYSKNGSKQNKNLFGGIISILMTMLIFGGSIFFVSQFFDRSQISLISNFDEDPNVSLEKFNNLPLMVRLSGNMNAVIPDNHYKIRFFALTFDENQGSTQTAFPVTMKKCDVEKIEKKEIFKSIKDIDSYFCPEWDKAFDLYGIYGSTNFTYAIMFFSPCVNSPECADKTSVYSSLSSSYFDYITLTNTIQHYSPDPNYEYVYKGRIAVSSSIYKRIWVYFEKIIYITDIGYIFEEKTTKVFNNVKEYSVDVDLRNVTDTDFLWVTFLNYSSTTSFTRSYMKAQALLANIGGIIKGLSICGMIITFPIASNLANQDIINSVYDKNSSFNVETERTDKDSNNLKNMNYYDCNSIRKRSMSKLTNSDMGNVNVNKKENPKNSFDNCKSLSENNLITNSNELKKLNKLNIKHEKEKILAAVDKNKVNNYISLAKNENSNQEQDLNYKKLVFSKTEFKFNYFNLIDPFQLCLNKDKKIVYNERLNKAYRLLNRDNLLASIQELNSLKEVVFDEVQLEYFDNLFKQESNATVLSRCFESIFREEDKHQYNSKLVSLLISR